MTIPVVVKLSDYHFVDAVKDIAKAIDPMLQVCELSSNEEGHWSYAALIYYRGAKPNKEALTKLTEKAKGISYL